MNRTRSDITLLEDRVVGFTRLFFRRSTRNGVSRLEGFENER